MFRVLSVDDSCRLQPRYFNSQLTIIQSSSNSQELNSKGRCCVTSCNLPEEFEVTSVTDRHPKKIQKRFSRRRWRYNKRIIRTITIKTKHASCQPSKSSHLPSVPPCTSAPPNSTPKWPSLPPPTSHPHHLTESTLFPICPTIMQPWSQSSLPRRWSCTIPNITIHM